MKAINKAIVDTLGYSTDTFVQSRVKTHLITAPLPKKVHIFPRRFHTIFFDLATHSCDNKLAAFVLLKIQINSLNEILQA